MIANEFQIYIFCNIPNTVLCDGINRIAYAQNDVVSDTTALITAFGALFGSIGGIIIAVVGFVANARKSDKISDKEKKGYEDLMKIGVSLQKTDRWILENEHKFKSLVEIMVATNLAIEKNLKDKQLEIPSLTKELNDAKKELEDYYDTVVPKTRVSQ